MRRMELESGICINTGKVFESKKRLKSNYFQTMNDATPIKNKPAKEQLACCMVEAAQMTWRGISV